MATFGESLAAKAGMTQQRARELRRTYDLKPPVTSQVESDLIELCVEHRCFPDDIFGEVTAASELEELGLL